MKINYDNLWKKVDEKSLRRTELRKKARLSSSTYTKLVNNESVTIDVLLRICEALQCDISEILRCEK